MIKDILFNPYVSNVICGIVSGVVSVVILYFFQRRYSISKIKQDFRCAEIIMDVHCGISVADSMFDDDTMLPKKSNQKEFINCCKKHASDIQMCNQLFTNDNNQILIRSVESCFFINLNFELLGIINNIKNRLPNLKEKYPTVNAILKTRGEPNIKEIDIVGNYITDLRFITQYWKALLDYLRYDPRLIDKTVEVYNERYSFKSDVENNDVLESHVYEAQSLARKEVRKERLHGMFRKRNRKEDNGKCGP